MLCSCRIENVSDILYLFADINCDKPVCIMFFCQCFTLRCSLFCCPPLFTFQVKPERSFRSSSAELYNPLLSSPLWIKSSESSLGRLSCLDGSCHWDPWDCTWLSARDDATTSLWYRVLPQSSETFSLGGNTGRNRIRSQRDLYTRNKAFITHKQHPPPPTPPKKKKVNWGKLNFKM